MIESIKIKNFQKHEDFKLTLDPKITTLTGATDRGKSSILRALRWLCLNKPNGDGFIKHGESECSVRVKVDGHRITRTKKKTGNFYKLDDKEFTAFGSEVPQEIANILNVSEENFQRQLSGPYWLELTPGQVSKELNRIINLDLIDRVLGDIATELRQAKAVVEITKERLTSAQNEVESLVWTKQAEQEMGVLQQQEQDLQRQKDKLYTIKEVGKLIKEHREVIKRYNKAQQPGAKTLEIGQQIAAKQARLEGLLLFRDNIKEAKEEACRVQKKLEETTKRFKKATQGQMCPICGKKLA